MTVRYQHLSVLSRMTVGDRSLPTLKKTVKRRAEVRASSASTRHCMQAKRPSEGGALQR